MSVQASTKTSLQRIVLAVLLFSCFLTLPTLMITHDVRADSGTPGVMVGQWAHYSLTGSDAGDVTGSNFTVTNIVGTNVTFTDVDTHADGTATTDLLWVDINSGPQNPASGDYFVITTGKPVGQSVYPGNYHFSQLPIQDVTTRNYASSSRQAAHVQARNQTQVNATSTSPYTYEDYYWDQSTGIFTEILKTLQGSTLLHVVMDFTNIWGADNPFGAFLAANAILTFMSAGLVAIVVVGALAIRRRRHR